LVGDVLGAGVTPVMRRTASPAFASGVRAILSADTVARSTMTVSEPEPTIRYCSATPGATLTWP
jgi:hypothetical protein